MVQPETWKELGEYSGKAWGVLGPLVGVLVGAYIANRNQKKHWIADNKRAEYRELLSTVHRNSMKMAAICTAPRSNPGLTVEEQKEYDELNLEVVQVMDDRMFINHEINDVHVRKLWVEAEYALHKHRKVGEFSMGVGQILRVIRVSAEKIID
jgi:hypothetical protein